MCVFFEPKCVKSKIRNATMLLQYTFICQYLETNNSRIKAREVLNAIEYRSRQNPLAFTHWHFLHSTLKLCYFQVVIGCVDKAPWSSPCDPRSGWTWTGWCRQDCTTKVYRRTTSGGWTSQTIPYKGQSPSLLTWFRSLLVHVIYSGVSAQCSHTILLYVCLIVK